MAGQRVDFIKMDVQGWEMEVLRGMEAILNDPAQNHTSPSISSTGHRVCGTQAAIPLEPLEFLSTRKVSISFRIVGGQNGTHRGFAKVC